VQAQGQAQAQVLALVQAQALVLVQVQAPHCEAFLLDVIGAYPAPSWLGSRVVNCVARLTQSGICHAYSWSSRSFVHAEVAGAVKEASRRLGARSRVAAVETEMKVAVSRGRSFVPAIPFVCNGKAWVLCNILLPVVLLFDFYHVRFC
jgi:hypothetical protein